MVSIPVGFFQALQPNARPLQHEHSGRVSIPVGFFQALQHSVRNGRVGTLHCFNPCRVFSGLATMTDADARAEGYEFQSLSGFFRPCNCIRFRAISSSRPVSIPVGFFQALQRGVLGSQLLVICRFNPCRVFSGLATVLREEGMITPPGFNPCRVFSGLATLSPPRPRLACIYVSIPVGFFQALQPRSGLGSAASSSFNPCRVFSGLATLPIWTTVDRTRWFQSLSGFFRPCNAEHRRHVEDAVFVSIPVGFFQALQQ